MKSLACNHYPFQHKMTKKHKKKKNEKPRKNKMMTSGARRAVECSIQMKEIQIILKLILVYAVCLPLYYFQKHS